MKSIRFSNRTISYLNDLDDLILDIAEVMKQAMEKREIMRQGNYTLQAPTPIGDDEIEVLIPFFNTPLLAAQMR